MQNDEIIWSVINQQYVFLSSICDLPPVACLSFEPIVQSDSVLTK
jgi:hypothetical protein